MPTRRAYERLLQLAPHAMLVLDAKGLVLAANTHAERVLGYAPGTLAGVRADALFAGHARLTSAEAAGSAPMTALQPDGARHTLDVAFQPFEDEGRRLLAVSLRDDRARPDDGMFRELLEAAPDAMIIVDHVGTIRRVNAQAESLFGYTREEMRGEKVELLIPARFHARHEGHRAEFFAGPRTRPMGQGLDLRGRRKDGSEFPVEISLSPLRTDDGTTFVTAAVRDVTARQQAAEVERQLAAIVLSSEDAIYAKDLEGTVTSWNPAAERMSGYAADEIVGSSIGLILPPTEVDVEREQRGRIARGEAIEAYDTRRLRKDGTVFNVSLRLSPIRDAGGRVTGASVIARDIADRIRAERERRRNLVTRQLVRRMLRELSSSAVASITLRRELGRSLGGETAQPDEALVAQLEAFEAMGVGELRLDAEQDGRYAFSGTGLLEMTPGAGMPTCHIALGVLEGLVGRRHDADALGAEIGCQSQGKPRCTFVVRARRR